MSDVNILLSLEEMEDLEMNITDDFELEAQNIGKKENVNLDYYANLIY